MADYTYAASSRKLYDEMVRAENERVNALAEAYAEKEKTANKTYTAALTDIHDRNVKAQEETAAADIAKTNKAYDADFDANAASELARRRALKEQMAHYGLGQSGFNATNQTALTAARHRADAATRAARQAAEDAIRADLRQYKTDAANKLAETLATSERESADRVLKNEQALQGAVHQNALDRTALESEEAEQLREDARQQNKDAQQMKEWVDDHNRAIYQTMLDAYDSGNAALAEEYAKQLWQINEEGNVVPLPFETEGAGKFVKEQAAMEAKRLENEIKGTTPKVEKDELSPLGYPTMYEDEVEDIRGTFEILFTVADEQVKAALVNHALNKLYMIERRSKDETSAGYMNAETFNTLLLYLGVTKEQYQAHKAKLGVV